MSDAHIKSQVLAQLKLLGEISLAERRKAMNRALWDDIIRCRPPEPDKAARKRAASEAWRRTGG